MTEPSDEDDPLRHAEREMAEHEVAAVKELFELVFQYVPVGSSAAESERQLEKIHALRERMDASDSRIGVLLDFLEEQGMPHEKREELVGRLVDLGILKWGRET